MAVLAKLVRELSPLPTDWPASDQADLPNVSSYIQEALTIIGDQEADFDPQKGWLDLSHTNLKAAKFEAASLHGVNLSGANLASANLKLANLTDTDLTDADLTDVFITREELRDRPSAQQIQAAKHWEKAHYDSDLRTQLGL